MDEQYTPEIRINDMYASHLQSHYKESIIDDSTPKKRHRNVRTSEWLEKVRTHLTGDQHPDILLPPNCRFVKHYREGSIIVIEEPPAMRTIRVGMDMTRDSERLKSKELWEKFGYTDEWFQENKQPYVFNLAIPYAVHVFIITSGLQFNRGRFFFRPRPLLGNGDTLFKAPFLNISSNQSVCYGDTAYKGPGTSIAREVDHVLRVFWSAPFNTDYIDNYTCYENIPGLCDYFTWQYYSQTNPMFIYDADWIPHHKNLGETIEHMAHNNKFTDHASFHFQTLEDLFSRPVTSPKTVKVGRTMKTERHLIFDMCNGHILADNGLNLNMYVGDPIMYPNDRVAYIDSFVGVQGITTPQYIRMQIGDKFPMIKLTKKTQQFLIDKIKEIRYEAFIEVKGVKYQAGDIISTKNRFGHEIYKKIHYIRKTNDDKIELRIGSEYWLADTFEWDNVKKVDISNPEIDGEKIDKDIEYHYFPSTYASPSPFSKTTTVKFHDIITRSNRLYAKFQETCGGRQTYTMDLTSTNRNRSKLYKPEDTKELPNSTFCIGRTLLKIYNVDSHDVKETIYRHKDAGIFTSLYCRVKNSSFSIRSTADNLLNEEGTSFHIESNNNIIHFDIDDKVVVADWIQPLEVLKIKTITGFLKNEETNSIDFILEDKHGQISNVQYVDLSNGVVNVGKVRKVTNELEGVTIGTKIVAKQARISCFPKKDVNIIVAFIIDTGGEPLVLCSNGCTLWFTDMMEKFELINMKDKRWKKLQHAPLDVTKIKLQPGDIINGHNYNRSTRGYIVVRSGRMGMRINRLDFYHEFDDYMVSSKSFFADMVFDCIPNPRVTPSQQQEMGVVSAFPNFHGGLNETPTNVSPYKLLNETGRFPDVSSLCE